MLHVSCVISRVTCHVPCVMCHVPCQVGDEDDGGGEGGDGHRLQTPLLPGRLGQGGGQSGGGQNINIIIRVLDEPSRRFHNNGEGLGLHN